MSTNEEKNLAAIAVVGLLAFIPLAIVFNGWVFWVLWGWFFVPLGAPIVGLAHAIGISTTCRFLLPIKRDKSAEGNLLSVLGYQLAVAALFLGTGWIAKQFI